MATNPFLARRVDQPAAAPSNPFLARRTDPVATPQDEGRGVSGVVADLWRSYAGGSNALLKIAGDMYGLTTGDMDNWASNQGQRGTEYWQERKTPQLKALEQQRKERVDSTDSELGKAGVAFWETMKSPSLLSSFIFEQMPQLLPVGGIGRGAGLAAKAMGAGAKTAGAVATGAAVGTGSAMQGADAGGQAFEDLMTIPNDVWLLDPAVARRVDRGEDLDAVKRDVAGRLSRNAAVSSAIVSVGLNMLPGARVLERALAGAKLPQGRVTGALSGYLGESLQEGLEEGTGRYFANLATGKVDSTVDPMGGVGEATGLGAAGGIFGGIAGAMGGRRREEEEQINRIIDAPDVDEAIKAAGDAIDMNTDQATARAMPDWGLVPKGEETPGGRAPGSVDFAPTYPTLDADLVPMDMPTDEELAEIMRQRDAAFRQREEEQARKKDEDFALAAQQKADQEVEEALIRANLAGDDANPAMKLAFEAALRKKKSEWVGFTPDTGTLNVPRAEMPQIKAEHRGAMVNFLKARGIESTQESVPADTLKPTQAEFSPAKVAQAKKFKGGDRSILVSSDNYVIDGHHQWLSRQGQDIKIIRLDKPAAELLDDVRAFPSAGSAAGATSPQISSEPELIPDFVTPNKLRGYAQNRLRYLADKSTAGTLSAVERREQAFLGPDVLTNTEALAEFYEVTLDTTQEAASARAAQIRNIVDKAPNLKQARVDIAAQLGDAVTAEQEQAIKAAWSSKQQKRRQKINDRDSLATAVAKLGGISMEWRVDITGDTKINKTVAGIGPVFSKSGTSPDDMASMLAQRGYFTQQDIDNPQDSDAVNLLSELLRTELAGGKKRYQLSSTAAEEELEALYAAQAEQAEAQREMEYDAIAAEFGQDAADQARAYDEALIQLSAELEKETERQILDQKETDREQANAEDATETTAYDEVWAGYDEEGTDPAEDAGEIAQGVRQITPDFFLTTETEEERREREQRASDQTIEQKDQANRELEFFDLAKPPGATTEKAPTSQQSLLGMTTRGQRQAQESATQPEPAKRYGDSSNYIMNSNGQPFATEEEADQVIATQGINTSQSVPVQGGWAVDPYYHVPQRRAKPGGERGANGEWYEGGKFIATSERTVKGEQTRPSTPAQPEGNPIIGFGKYRGRDVRELINSKVPAERNYAQWMAESLMSSRPELAPYLKPLLEQGKPAPQIRMDVNTPAILSQLGLVVNRDGDSFLVSGNTYMVRATMNQMGGRFDYNTKAYRFQTDPSQEIASAYADESGQAVDVDILDPKGKALREQAKAKRKELDQASNEKPTPAKLAAEVSQGTKDLVRRGLQFGMTEDVVKEQIEDIGQIVWAYKADKPMFMLASEAGSGKTFVLGGAIKEILRSNPKANFTYVAMNQNLIEQIKSDLAPYGIADKISFFTYTDVSGNTKAANDMRIGPETVLLFDEAHNIKNIDQAARAARAMGLAADSKYTVYASATPYENPVEMKYLEPTGVFDSLNGHTNFALAYGAKLEPQLVYEYGNPVTVMKPVWPGGKEARESAKAARDWFDKRGMFTQRRKRLPAGMVKSAFKSVEASPKYVEMFNRVTDAYDAALDEVSSTVLRMHKMNVQKRILEAAKVNDAIAQAEQAIAEGIQAVIFVETKSERTIGNEVPYEQMLEEMLVWQSTRDDGDPPPYPAWKMALAKAFDEDGINYDLPSTVDAIYTHFGPTATGVYVGAKKFDTVSVTEKSAQRDKEEWLAGKKQVLVATMAKGGTGLSLHPTKTNNPRKQIGINLPWKATGVDQVSGRLARYGMQSEVGIDWIFASNILVELTIARRVGSRMESMGATVSGITMKSADQLQEWDFEAGEEINVSERSTVFGVEEDGGPYRPMNQQDMFLELDKVKKAAKEDPYKDAELRPDTTPEQLKLGRDAMKSMFNMVSRRLARLTGDNQSFSVLGARLFKDLATQQSGSLIGQEVRTPEDLAVIAQVYRDPRFETFRIIYTKKQDDGTIQVVAETAVTSRLPAIVNFRGMDTKKVQSMFMEARDKYGADGYWMMHNHPSGDPSPSNSDIGTTKVFARNISGFQGHMVLDSNAFTVIRANGLWDRYLADLGSQEFDTDEEYSGAWIGQSMNSLPAIASMAKRIESNDKTPILITTDRNLKVTMVAKVPNQIIDADYTNSGLSDGKAKQAQYLAVLRTLVRATGSGGWRFLVVESLPLSSPRMVSSGVFSDVLTFSGESFIQKYGMGRFRNDVFEENANTFIGEQENEISIEEPPANMQEEAEAQLSVLHNLSAENLKFADEMGGLAVPSLAVVRSDMGMEDFGEITLIGRKELGDPAQEPVFDADAYSATFPIPEYPKVSTKIAQAMTDSVKPWIKKYSPRYDSAQDATWDYAVNNPDPEKIIKGWMSSIGIKVMFLNETTGKAPRVFMMKAPLEYPFSEHPAVVEAVKKAYIAGYQRSGASSNEAIQVRRDAAVAVRTALKDMYAGKPEGKRIISAFVDSTITDEGEIRFNTFERIIRDQQNSGVQIPDADRIEASVSKLMKGNEANFKKWVETKVLGMFGAPFLKLGGKKVPYTIGNIAEKMISANVKGKEKTITFSPGKARAVAAKRYTSLQWMRNEAKYAMTKKADVDEFRKQADEVLTAWRDSVLPYYTEKNWRGEVDVWNGLDSSMKTLAHYAINRQKRGGAAALKEGLSKNNFRGVPKDVIDAGVKAGMAMMHAPVPYFESKPQRVVTLDEFAGAVVPRNADAETFDILAKHNIKVATYKGRYNETERTAATIKLRNQLAKQGEEVLFQSEGHVTMEGKPGSRLTKAAIEAAIAPALEKLRTEVQMDVAVVQSFSDLDQEIIDFADGNTTSSGVYLRGKVYLVADNIPTTDYAQVTLAHELIGHKGVLEGLTPEEWTDIKATVNRLLERGHTDTVSIMEEVKRRYGTEVDENTLMKEFIAVAAERRQVTGTLQRVMDTIKEALRRMLKALGFTAAFSDADINIILSNSERYLRTGQRTTFTDTGASFSQDGKSAPLRKQLQTETEAFRRWFGDSKVVDADGKPLVLYHATTSLDDFNQFVPSERGTLGKGLYFTDDHKLTSLMSEGLDNGRVIPAYMKLENPYTFEQDSEMEGEFDFDSPAVSLLVDVFGSRTARYMIENESDEFAYFGDEIAEELKKRGHDGIIMKFEDGDGEYVAFDPTQIKSAIGNRGTFDPADPNILFSKGAPNSTGFSVPDETLTTVAIRKMQDKFKVLKDLQTNIRGAGGTITDKNDAYLAEELFHGKAENDLREMRDQYIEPLSAKMAKFKISREQLDQFMYARHAPERNAHIASINPAMPDGGSGMKNAESARILKEVRASGKQDQYQQLAAIVDDIVKMQRDMIVEGGLEDDGLVAAWQDTYKHYVPLKGWAEDTKDQGIPRTGSGFNIGGKETRRALGRSSLAASPVSYAIVDLTEKIIRKRKNEVGNALLDLIESNPNPDYWEVYTNDSPEMDRRIVKTPEGEQVKEMPLPMHMLKDRYFTTKKDGRTYFMKLNDPRLMTAMKNLGPESNGALLRVLGGINRILSALNTSYSPEFLISNFARDVQTAVLNLQAEQSLPPGVGKASGKAIAAQTIKDIPSAMKAIYARLRGAGADSEWGKLFDQFRADGAKTGYFDMKDLDGQAAEIDRMIEIAQGGWKGNALRWAQSSAAMVETLNQSVENAVRLSAYANAIKAGLSRPRAASLAKNMTVNFNRRGEIGTTLNALYMFANASIQGSANFIRTMGTLKGDKTLKWANLNNAQRLAVGITAAAFFLSMANRAGAGEDDDDVNWYDKVPAYVRERNIILMKSLFGGQQNGEYWKIPLPYGFNVFSVIGDSLSSVLDGDEDPVRAAGNVVLAALGSFSPIGYQDSKTIQGMLLKNAAPTVVKPVVELALNENFAGSSIFNENFAFGTPSPDSAMGRRSTPEAYKKIATWLNEVTGGSEFRSGAVDVNPDVMQYVLDYLGGSAYSFFGSKVPDYLYKQVTGSESEVGQIPFVSRISGRVLPYADTETFYQRRDDLMQIEDEFLALTPEDRQRYPVEYRSKLGLRGLLKVTEKKLRQLRKRRDGIYADDITVRERDVQLKDVEATMKQAVDEFNSAYNAIESGSR
jgi:hypothetical protein